MIFVFMLRKTKSQQFGSYSSRNKKKCNLLNIDISDVKKFAGTNEINWMSKN